MPLGESMLTTLKSNKSLALNTSKRFKTSAHYKESNALMFDFPEATPELLNTIRARKRRKEKWDLIKMLSAFVLIMVCIVAYVLLYVN